MGWHACDKKAYGNDDVEATSAKRGQLAENLQVVHFDLQLGELLLAGRAQLLVVDFDEMRKQSPQLLPASWPPRWTAG